MPGTVRASPSARMTSTARVTDILARKYPAQPSVLAGYYATSTHQP
jgi:hypothetical protein